MNGNDTGLAGTEDVPAPLPGGDLYDALNPSTFTLKATGLSKQQYNSLSLLWVEVRHTVISLSKCKPEKIDPGIKERVTWVEHQVGQYSDFATAKAVRGVDKLKIPLTRWDVCVDPGPTTKYERGEVGIWARFSSASSNIYYSRLWEREWQGLKHSLPLRMVHKYYMLQLEVNKKPPIFVKGSKTIKTRVKEKGKLFAQEPFQVHGKSSQNEKFSFHIPVDQKRFPETITPSVFWGILQIYWHRNLQVLLRLFSSHLPGSWMHSLNLSMDRIHVYFDDFCKASGFSNAGKASLEPTSKRVKVQPRLGNNDTERKVDEAPSDTFQSWKQYLYMCEDSDMMDFDFMFAQFLQGEYDSLHDQRYCMKVHSRAAYLTRYCDHKNSSQDQPLKQAFDELSACSFDPPKGFNMMFDDQNLKNAPGVANPASGGSSSGIAFDGLSGLWDMEKQNLELILDVLKEFICYSSNSGNPGGEEDKDKERTISDKMVADAAHLPRMRASFSFLIFLFHMHDRIRDNIARFIDVVGDSLASDQLAKIPSNVEKQKTIFTEREIARYWLDLAEQFGFLNINNMEFGQEQTWKDFADGKPTHKLRMLTLKDDTVIQHNQLQRAARQQQHLPQRARRHTRELTERDVIDYNLDVAVYAHPNDEHLFHWYTEEGSLRYVQPSGN